MKKIYCWWFGHIWSLNRAKETGEKICERCGKHLGKYKGYIEI